MAGAAAVLLATLLGGRMLPTPGTLSLLASLLFGAAGFAVIGWRGALADAEKSGLLALVRPRPRNVAA